MCQNYLSVAQKVTGRSSIVLSLKRPRVLHFPDKAVRLQSALLPVEIAGGDITAKVKG